MRVQLGSQRDVGSERILRGRLEPRVERRVGRGGRGGREVVGAARVAGGRPQLEVIDSDPDAGAGTCVRDGVAPSARTDDLAGDTEPGGDLIDAQQSW